MSDILDNLIKIKSLLEAGDLISVRSACAQTLQEHPDNAQVLEILGVVSNAIAQDEAKRVFKGPSYRDWLQHIHDFIEPRGYVEIGVADGGSLSLASPSTRVIGVDPQFMISHQISAWAKIYKKESDQFFMDHDPKEILGGDFLDFAFIDGLHTFDQALRDFINIEKESHYKTVVAFHDIYPVEPITANRQRLTQFWLGDTWKVIPIIRKYRPELMVFTIPTFPSGLGIVTGLDPNSSVLEDNLDDIVASYMNNLDEDVLSLEKHLNIKENKFEIFDEVMREL